MIKKINFSLLLVLTIVFHSFSKDINYTDLYKYLVDLKGWKCEKPTGSSLKTPMGNAVNAKRSCEKGNKNIEVQIIAGTMASMAWAPFNMGIEYDSPEQLVKAKKLDGFKEVIMFNKSKENPTGTIAVLLNESQGTPFTIFVVNFDNMNYEEAENLVKKYPLKEISKIFK